MARVDLSRDLEGKLIGGLLVGLQGKEEQEDRVPQRCRVHSLCMYYVGMYVLLIDDKAVRMGTEGRVSSLPGPLLPDSPPSLSMLIMHQVPELLSFRLQHLKISPLQ